MDRFCLEGELEKLLKSATGEGSDTQPRRRAGGTSVERDWLRDYEESK